MSSSYSTTRRRFLIGGGSIIALPFFESLWAPRVLAAATSAPKLVIINFPLGTVRNAWRPNGDGTNFTLSGQLSSLAAHKADLIVPTGLKNHYAGQTPTGNGTHARSAGCFLTCVELAYGGNYNAGVSIDRFIAEKLNLNSVPKTISVAAPGQSYDGFGYSGVYGSNISWLNGKTPAGRLTNTREVFNKLFTNVQQPTMGSNRKMKYRKSVLDSVMGEIATLKTNVSTGDLQKLDQYLTGLREVEKATVVDSNAETMACHPGTARDEKEFKAFTKTMIDMIVIALSCGQTRIATYLMDYEFGSNYPNNYSTDYHGVSHYKGGHQAKYEETTAWYASQFAYLIGQLKTYKDGNGQALLDSTIAVIGSGLSDGEDHQSYDLPMLVAGRGGGMMPGKVIGTKAPLANLWVSIASRMGASTGSFGDSNGSLGGI